MRERIKAALAITTPADVRERVARVIDPDARFEADIHESRYDAVRRESAYAQADAFLALLPDEAAIRADERERCAKVAEGFGQPYALNTNTGAMMFRAETAKIAAAIRAGGREQ